MKKMPSLPLPLNEQNSSTPVDFDSESPQSFVSMAPEPVRSAVAKLSASPELWPLDESELLERLREKQRYPTGTDSRLRFNLWLEFERCLATGRKEMSSVNVYAGVCTKQHYQKIMKDKYKAAWIITPPADWMKFSEEALLFSTIRLREGLNAPLYTKRGEFNVKVLEVILKIHEQLSQRVLGAVPQKVLHAHAHRHQGVKEKIADYQSMSPDERMKKLEAEIAELESRDRLAPNAGALPGDK